MVKDCCYAFASPEADTRSQLPQRRAGRRCPVGRAGPDPSRRLRGHRDIGWPMEVLAISQDRRKQKMGKASARRWVRRRQHAAVFGSPRCRGGAASG